MMYGLNFEAKPEEVRLYLCKPDGTTIAELSSAYKRRLTLNYGGIHQLSLQVPYKVFHNGEFIRNPQVDLVRGHYLIRLEKGVEMKEYFIITNPVNAISDGQEVKTLTCYLRPYELKDKLVRLYKGVKTLPEVLSDTLLAQTDYTIGYIDASLALKYRNFDVSEQTLIDFTNDLADTYGGIVMWDSINKKINFYLDENLVFDEGLEIAYGKYLKSLTENEKFDDVVTRLYCYGQNGISINGVNTTGAFYIEDYSFYIYPFERDANRNVIKHSNYMSDSLCHALLDYYALVESKSSAFQNLLSQRKAYVDSQTPLLTDLDSLERQMDFIEKQIAVWVALNQDLTANSLGTLRITSGASASGNLVFTISGSTSKTITVPLVRDEDSTVTSVAAKVLATFQEQGMVASLDSVNGVGVIQFQLPNSGRVTSVSINTGGTGVSVTNATNSLNGQKAAKLIEINNKKAEIAVIQTNIDNVDAQTLALKNTLAIDSNFTQAQKKEWTTYVKEKSWTDGNYTDANDLLVEGKKKLAQASQPIVAYEIDSVDFKSALNTSHDWEKAKLGGVTRIFYPSFNINIKTKIIVMDWDIDGKSLKFTIANTKDIKSGILKIKDLMKGMVSTSATMNISKTSWDKADSAYENFNNFINGKFDANKQMVTAGENENYTLNQYGFMMKDPSDPLNYLRMVHNILAFTNDGGNTFKHAISSQGIHGEYIVGTIGTFAKVYASSIVVGADNQQLPDSVIASAGNWNSTYDNAVEYSDEMLRAAKSYSDTTLVSANGHSNQINTAIRNDLRLTAALPTSISLNSNGITATTTANATKFARLDHRGLYIQNGALQITSTDGTTVIDGSGVNASKIYTGSLNGIYMTIGTGNSVAKFDGNGLYIGNANFGAAPFRVDLSGNVYANNITLTGKIESSEMNNSVIKGGSLEIGTGNSVFKADLNGIYLGSQTFASAPFRVTADGDLTANNATLTNANISGNINMTGGSINWASIEKPAYSPYEVGALPLSAPQLTNITSTGIYTGSITANQITAGRITANQIDTTNLAVARLYQNGSPSNYVVLGGNFGDLELYYGGSKYFSIYNDIDAVTLKHRGRDHLRFSSSTGSSHAIGNWNFSGATVTGLNTVAVFG